MSIPRGADTSEAHFHPAAQFQVILEGDMVFHHLSLGEMELHYTDSSTAYGPFWVGNRYPQVRLCRAAGQGGGNHLEVGRRLPERDEPGWA